MPIVATGVRISYASGFDLPSVPVIARRPPRTRLMRLRGVCVAADAKLRLEGIGEAVQKEHGVGPIEEVVMTRLEGGAYKDAVRFANGKEVLLQRLDCGLTAVLVAASSDLIDIEDIAPPTAVREPELV